MLLIGISGAARAGKDTLARTIQYVLPNTVTMAFAHAVKLEADPICLREHGITAFTEDPDQKKIIRPILIDIGHGRRQEKPNFWVDKLAEQVDAKRDTSHILITDLRYANESNMVHEKGGIVIFVQRDAQADIPSERESLPNVKWDIKIDSGAYSVIALLQKMFPGILVQ